MEKGSVLCALPAFQATSLLHYPALIFFPQNILMCNMGDEQYLDTAFGVILAILAYNAAV